jgi:hypothetical protein
MDIFKIENKIVQPTTEVLLISPFKEIWEQDKTKNKTEALQHFAYIEFLCSPKKSNPYFGYTTKEIRDVKIKMDVYKDKDYILPKLVEEGIEKYKEFLNNASFNYSYFMSARGAAEKIKNFFDTFNMNERNKSGVPIYKPREITSAIIDSEATLQKLESLQKKIEQELLEQTKNKRNKEINYFEE